MNISTPSIPASSVSLTEPTNASKDGNPVSRLTNYVEAMPTSNYTVTLTAAAVSALTITCLMASVVLPSTNPTPPRSISRPTFLEFENYFNEFSQTSFNVTDMNSLLSNLRIVNPGWLPKGEDIFSRALDNLSFKWLKPYLPFNLSQAAATSFDIVNQHLTQANLLNVSKPSLPMQPDPSSKAPNGTEGSAEMTNTKNSSDSQEKTPTSLWPFFNRAYGENFSICNNTQTPEEFQVNQSSTQNHTQTFEVAQINQTEAQTPVTPKTDDEIVQDYLDQVQDVRVNRDHAQPFNDTQLKEMQVLYKDVLFPNRSKDGSFQVISQEAGQINANTLSLYLAYLTFAESDKTAPKDQICDKVANYLDAYFLTGSDRKIKLKDHLVNIDANFKTENLKPIFAHLQKQCPQVEVFK